jgi:hypothetical protein
MQHTKKIGPDERGTRWEHSATGEAEIVVEEERLR